MKINGKTIFAYKSCSTLPIYNFCMVSITGDYRYMIKSFNEDDEKSYAPFKNDPILVQLYEDVTSEYREIIEDKKEYRKLKDIFNINYLQGKYDLASEVLAIYNETQEIEVLGCLKSLEFDFDEDKPIGPQIDIIIKKLIGIKNRIKIEAAKFKAKYKVPEQDEIEEISTIQVIKNLEDRALYFGMELELGYPIDIRKTTLLRWANLEVRCKEKRLLHERSKMQRNGKN